MTIIHRSSMLADPDGLQKWRESHDEQEARFAEERACEEQHTQPQHGQHTWGEIEKLYTEIATSRLSAR
jgi:hypothetical protein